MKILLTGGFGTLGKNLSVDLRGFGYDIEISSSKKKKFLDFKNHIISLQSKKKKIIQILKSFDIIIHASGIDKATSIEKPDFAFEHNIEFTKFLTKCAIDAKIKKFIFFSTAQVYSNKLLGKINENTLPYNKSPYALSNLIAEKVITYYSENTKNANMCPIILRLTNIVSAPRTINDFSWGLVINDFCKQAVLKKTIVIQNPNEFKDFLSVGILSKIIIFSINKIHKSCTLNIGSEKTISLLKIAEIIKKVYFNNFNKEIKIIKKKKYNYNNKNKFLYYSSNNKIKKIVKLNNLETEIKKILIFCIANKKNLK